MNGVYFLVIEISKGSSIKVGSLGRLFFEKGYYIYVGSAMNGLECRINRHLRREKKTHWHIDYILGSENANVERIFIKETSRKDEECKTAKKIASLGAVVEGFGCSDCMCRSHLFNVKQPVAALPGFRELKRI